MKKIHVWLPKNRWETGALTLFKGKPYFSCPVRGKADNNRARKEGNKHRDALLPFGDTPSGVCEPAEWIVFDPPHKTFGRGFLPLVGASGPFLEAMSTETSEGRPKKARTGMGIHGGRGECSDRGKLYLTATYGCLRVRDSDLGRLMDLTEGEEVEVTIFDV